VLVTNDDGVFLIDTEGEISQLVKGRVAYAVDDTRGGLLFQVERGRNWSLSFGGPHERSQETVVWWVPTGSSAAQELLVPTPGAGHWLSLHDAYRTGNESFSVLYTRSEGSVPFEDAWENLRIFDRSTGEAREVATVGGWEFDFIDVSVNGGVIAGTSDCWVGGIECILFTMDGEHVTPAGPPTGHECREHGAGRCDYSCVVSADGSQVAFLETPIFDGEPVGETSVVVRELESGLEAARRAVGFDVPWNWSLDFAGNLVLVNHRTEYPNLREVFAGALLIDLSDGSMTEVSVAGRARFATSPLDIGGPVVPPTTAAIQLRADGLGIVDFGDPVEEAVAVLTAVLGSPDRNYDSEGTPTEADRIVAWETLALQFYPLPEVPSGPALIYYFTGSPEFATVEGIRVGSSAAELQDAYPDLRSGDGCEPDPAIPIVRVDRSSEESLYFYLDGDIADPQTRVGAIRGGSSLPSC
jgi:hypothetical protein